MSGTELLIESELQKLGNDALQDWGNSQQKKKAVENFSSRHRKKRLHWHSLFGTIQVIEQTYYNTSDGKVVRPFSDSAQIHCRGYSLPLQRAITDFGYIIWAPKNCKNIMV